MKKIIFLIFLLASISYGHDRNYNWETYGIKGKVRQLIEVRYSVENKFGELQKKTSAKIIYLFDDNGKLLKTKSFEADGTLFITSNIHRDTEGHLKEWETIFHNGKLAFKMIPTYDENKNLKEMTTYNPDGSLYEKEIYEYDESGFITEVATYSDDGSLSNKKIFTQDKEGTELEIKEYEGESNLLLKKTAVIRDEMGNLKKENIYGDFMNPDLLEEIIIYTTDTKGNYTKKEKYKCSEKFGKNTEELYEMTEYLYEFYQ